MRYEGRGDEREGRGRQGSDVRALCEKQGFGMEGTGAGERSARKGGCARGSRSLRGERTGNLAVLLLHLRHLDADLLADLLGDGLAVDDGGVRAGRLGERASGGRADGAGAAPEGRGRGDLPPEGGGGGGGGHRDSEDVYARAGGDGLRAERRAQP